MAADSDAGDTANDDKEPTTERTETVEVELVPADVERIEFEIEQGDIGGSAESIEEWIEHAIRMHFAWIDKEADSEQVNVQVGVPPVMARRAELEAKSGRQRGKDTTVDDILINTIEYEPEYLVDGEPIGSDEESDP